MVEKLSNELSQARDRILRINEVNSFMKTSKKKGGSVISRSTLTTQRDIKNSQINSDVSPIKTEFLDTVGNSVVSESNEFEILFKIKEEENKKLKKEIQLLNKENTDLKLRLEFVIKEQNLEKFIKDLELLIKFNIDEINKLKADHDNSIDKILLEENKSLKQKLDEVNNKYIEEIKKFEYFNELIKNDSIDLDNSDNLIDRNKIDIFDKVFNETIHDSAGIFESYHNIYSNTKTFMNKILDEFLGKNDHFKTNRASYSSFIEDQNQNHLQIQKDHYKERYAKLKNSFTQLCFVNIYYENIVFQVLNRALLDLSNYKNEAKWKNEYFGKIDNFANVLNDYLFVLDALKNHKIYGRNSHGYSGIPHEGKNNIIKSVNKNSSNFVMNIKKNLQSNHVLDDIIEASVKGIVQNGMGSNTPNLSRIKINNDLESANKTSRRN